MDIGKDTFTMAFGSGLSCFLFLCLFVFFIFAVFCFRSLYVDSVRCLAHRRKTRVDLATLRRNACFVLVGKRRGWTRDKEKHYTGAVDMQKDTCGTSVMDL